MLSDFFAHLVDGQRLAAGCSAISGSPAVGSTFAVTLDTLCGTIDVRKGRLQFGLLGVGALGELQHLLTSHDFSLQTFNSSLRFFHYSITRLGVSNKGVSCRRSLVWFGDHDRLISSARSFLVDFDFFSWRARGATSYSVDNFRRLDSEFFRPIAGAGITGRSRYDTTRVFNQLGIGISDRAIVSTLRFFKIGIDGFGRQSREILSLLLRRFIGI